MLALWLSYWVLSSHLQCNNCSSVHHFKLTLCLLSIANNFAVERDDGLAFLEETFALGRGDGLDFLGITCESSESLRYLLFGL